MKIEPREALLHLNSYYYINYRFILENFLNSYFNSNGLLLDAGCGKGKSIICPPEKAEIVGIDVMRSNVEACRSIWKNRSYVVADLTHLPFNDGEFIGALSADVLEHVDNKTAAINELARTTRKGGFFVGSSSNILNPVLWLDVKLSILIKPLVMKLAEPGHYDRHTRFSPSSLAKILNSAGYKMNNLYLLGFPLISENMQKKPVIALLWIFFDKLTRKKPLIYLKEALVWKATRS
jgi:ubiquinone/menaquinone biosynthesis C-methylase UbiE